MLISTNVDHVKADYIDILMLIRVKFNDEVIWIIISKYSSAFRSMLQLNHKNVLFGPHICALLVQGNIST